MFDSAGVQLLRNALRERALPWTSESLRVNFVLWGPETLRLFLYCPIGGRACVHASFYLGMRAHASGSAQSALSLMQHRSR